MANTKKTTKLKKFFSYKIYAWITILIVILMTGLYTYGYFSGRSNNKGIDFQTGIMVKKLEKVHDVTFLNVGVQEIVSKKERDKLIPYSTKTY